MATAAVANEVQQSLDASLGSPMHQVSDAEVAEAGKLEQVKFVEVRPCYPPSHDILLKYWVGSNVEVTSHDWVGVYKVGWKSPKNDYFTFVWSPAKGDESDYRSVLFDARYLPSDESSYQFCYVTRSGDIRGVSAPFQIRNDFTDDDLECVELDEDVQDAVLVQSRERRARSQEEEKAGFMSLQTKVAQLEAVEEGLRSQIERLSQQKEAAVREGERSASKVTELESKIADLQAEVKKLVEESDHAASEKEETVGLVCRVENKLRETVQQLQSSHADQERLAREHNELVRQKEDLLSCNQKLTNDLSGVEQMLKSTSEGLEQALAEKSDLLVVTESRKQELLQARQQYEQRQEEVDSLIASLAMANTRIVTEQKRLADKDEELQLLQERVVELQADHGAEYGRALEVHQALEDQVKTGEREIEALRDEIYALRLNMEQGAAEQRHTEQNQTTALAIAECNVSELMGENAALKEECMNLTAALEEAKQARSESDANFEGKVADLEEVASVLQAQNEELVQKLAEAEVASAAQTQQAVDVQAHFALQKAFEDSEQKYRELLSSYRAQSRVARAAEGTVKVLEQELTEQAKNMEEMRCRVREGADHYRTQYKKCAELERKLQEKEAECEQMVSGL